MYFYCFELIHGCSWSGPAYKSLKETKSAAMRTKSAKDHDYKTIEIFETSGNEYGAPIVRYRRTRNEAGHWEAWKAVPTA